MRTALLHYWLTSMRGGEMVLAQFCRLFPDADIYTHAFIPEKIDDIITRHPVHESCVARMPFGRSHCQKYLPLMPFAQSRWDLSEYDLLISSESGPVKGVKKPSGCFHICYCHTPMRYLWDMYEEYYKNSGIGAKLAMRSFKNYLRRYDLKSAECVDRFVANSRFVADRIKRIYGRESDVVYPPVDTNYFRQAQDAERKYFLMVGALVSYKRPDLAVDAFARMQNETLIVAGSGGMFDELQKRASSNVKFVKSPSKEQLRELYAGAKALIFPGIEDFGIIPVEAQAAGTPVVAMGEGGTAETVIDKVTGVYMREQSVTALLEAVESVKSTDFDLSSLRSNAEKFSTASFLANFRNVLPQGVVTENVTE